MDSFADKRFRFIKTFGILPVANDDRLMSDSLISGRIGFVIRAAECFVFNVSVATLGYYASRFGIKSFVYYDGEYKCYQRETGRHYAPVTEPPSVCVPEELLQKVDNRLAENLAQFDDPSAAIDFITTRVGFHPYYMQAKINKGIHQI